MKNNFYKLLILFVIAVCILSACDASRQSMHNHGVNNSSYKGY
jgi:hypothetical protein